LNGTLLGIFPVVVRSNDIAVAVYKRERADNELDAAVAATGAETGSASDSCASLSPLPDFAVESTKLQRVVTNARGWPAFPALTPAFTSEHCDYLFPAIQA